ncbi:hypothetical protein CASFOL_032518 [Castilleja foliolosa]|uniref:Uncharacterized protein n=1 Tax=Castilleja foliolosa TaxID=1961234 RepID=A0ABD3C4F4_9LAMI
MATSRSSSAAARLSSSAAAALRMSGSGQLMRSDLASAIVRPRALISPNENQISIPKSLSASFLNRIASRSALSRSYSTAAAAGQKFQEPKALEERKSRLTGLPWWHVHQTALYGTCTMAWKRYCWITFIKKPPVLGC